MQTQLPPLSEQVRKLSTEDVQKSITQKAGANFLDSYDFETLGIAVDEYEALRQEVAALAIKAAHLSKGGKLFQHAGEELTSEFGNFADLLHDLIDDTLAPHIADLEEELSRRPEAA